MTTNTAVTTTEKKELKPHEAFEGMLLKRQGEFMKALPSHISFDKFQRTVMTAVITEPKLLGADRASLLVSCLKAAQDGLLPDKRDAALVIFNTKAKDPQTGEDKWIDAVQYMPMYSGILKKVRQSDELASIKAHVVYKKDKFHYVLGDEERVIHEPYFGTEDRGEIVAAYCIAVLKDGTIMREVMTFQDIEKIRRKSKSGAATANDVKYKKAEAIGDPKGIWADWYEEMAKKTVFRRLAKWLPQSSDLIETALKNDESMQIMDEVKGSEARTTIDGNSTSATAIEHDETERPSILQQVVDEHDDDGVVAEAVEVEPVKATRKAPAGSKAASKSCSECVGTGFRVTDEGKEPCGDCGGTGTVKAA